MRLTQEICDKQELALIKLAAETDGKYNIIEIAKQLIVSESTSVEDKEILECMIKRNKLFAGYYRLARPDETDKYGDEKIVYVGTYIKDRVNARRLKNLRNTIEDYIYKDIKPTTHQIFVLLNVMGLYDYTNEYIEPNERVRVDLPRDNVGSIYVTEAWKDIVIKINNLTNICWDYIEMRAKEGFCYWDYASGADIFSTICSIIDCKYMSIFEDN